jgi:hypothetical protein
VFQNDKETPPIFLVEKEDENVLELLIRNSMDLQEYTVSVRMERET